MTYKNTAYQAVEQIKQIRPNFNPKIGIVLGSGLGAMVDHLDDAITINYKNLPGFPKLTVQGHSGNLVLGYLSGIPMVCLQGRYHAYEGLDNSVIKTYVRTLRLLGCEYFLATNASGSLKKEISPGSLMLVTDHINLQPTNPLIGPNDEDFGPRFYPLDNAYDIKMRKHLLQVAEEEKITLHQGVYVAVLGPHYETAAEIKAFTILGADAVGMSTVPEVLVANHCGMKVAVIATITNYATGLADCSHDHKAVVQVAAQAGEELYRLIKRFVEVLD
jgi:xanthosine phosphorylase